jgi:outer membrane lipoprotein-sorting protein
MKPRVSLLAVLAFSFLAPVARGPATAGEWDVSNLMESLARHPGGRVAFVETKHIAILDRPVESSGELVYRPPARLEKRTLKPNVESLVLDGDVLVIERGKQKYTLQLQQYPQISAVVGSIRGTLAGDLAALKRQYRLDLQGNPERWMLTLLPSDTRIAAIVQRIRISGARDELRQIEMLQADGDSSVMNIFRLAPQ